MGGGGVDLNNQLVQSTPSTYHTNRPIADPHFICATSGFAPRSQPPSPVSISQSQVNLSYTRYLAFTPQYSIVMSSATTTSLHDAASSGDLRAFKSILNNAPAGSKILSERNSDGKTPIMLAASNGQYSILDFVFANGLRGKSLLDLQTADGGSALMSAAAHGETEATHVLAKMGADINAADTDGWTALHFAAAAGEPAACQVLVSAGADINKRNKDNDTPLMIAEKLGATECIRAVRHPEHHASALETTVHMSGSAAA